MRKGYGAEIATLQDRIEHLEEIRTVPAPAQGRGVLNAMIATEQLDGRFTFADVIVVTIACIATGLLLTGTSVAIGILAQDFAVFKTCAAVCWIATGILGALVLILELLGIGAYSGASEKVSLEPRGQALTVTVQHAGNNSHLDFLHIDPSDFERVHAFARQALQLRAEGITNPTPEKYWIGRNRLWSNSTADRARFTTLRDRLIECKLARRSRNGWELRDSGWQLLADISNLEVHK